ncbi:MAG: CHAT domain-containing protein [Anaerolineales bacterium]|jgi:hypothetical protein
MAEYADLEIGLHYREIGSYAVEFRFSQPDDQADIRLGQGRPVQAVFDFEALTMHTDDPAAYGRLLTRALFADSSVQTAFAQAYASAQSIGAALRLRLMIGPSAPELHRLHWETLRNPLNDTPLSTSENIVFSRYLSSLDWRPVRLHSKGELRALLVVANPSNLADYGLAAIDVSAEIERAQQGLADVPAVVLSSAHNNQRPTLNNLIDSLRNEAYDILYLLCHGSLVKEQAWLWLEDDQGAAARVSGTELVTRMAELIERPRLVVLASCESAGDGIGQALAALGPRLAETGIPSVLAMQGKVSMQTMTEFMPVLFRELRRDGQIDRAVAVARGVVRQNPDYWMPVLFMRLKSGRIWYVPGFGEEENEFEKWESLVGFIRDKNCTPILGSGLIEAFLGSRREMSKRWAEKHGFPLSPQDREVLPRVAQYVVTHQSPAYIPIAVREVIRDELVRRFADELPAEWREKRSWSYSQVEQALDWAAEKSWGKKPEDPYRLLAQMRLPIYITAGTVDLMRRALIDAGADPQVRICPWNKWIPKEKVIYEETPTPEKPLVYHLFGHLDVPNSMVYAEDRFFDYLIGVTLNKSLIPSAVRAALSSTSLLFLGFQMDDWEFRTFFRYLMAQEGRELLKFYSHAAAQIEPEEERIVDVKRARNYLEEYFESENISIYWGNSGEFLKDLWQHL